MKMRTVMILFVLVGFAIGCKAPETAVSQANIDALDNMITNKNFEFRAEWAQPLVTTSLNGLVNSGLLPPGSSINRINLQGNSNFLRMEGDRVWADLPYYGERQAGGAYARATGIEFDGIPTDLEITENEKKQSYLIRFDIRNKAEAYQVSLELFPNLSGTISVNSTQRLNIRYSGTVLELEEGVSSAQ